MSNKKISATAQQRLESFQAKQQLEQIKGSRRSKDNQKSLMVAAGAVVLAIGAQFVYFSVGPGVLPPVEELAEEITPSEEPSNSSLVPDPAISENRIWEGSIEIAGSTLEIELDGAAAPQAVANFVSLAQEGFFEGIACHRLVNAGIFVLQCGDPDGTGGGGPGYDWGPIENAPADDFYPTGTLAMARVGDKPFSMGSQFFIVYADSSIPSDSAGGYSVFGRVTGGLEGLAEVLAAGVAGGGSDGRPALESKIGAIELR